MTDWTREMEEEAIAWLIRQRDPSFDDWETFEAWLAADAARARAYAELAAAAGNPKAVRAAGSACGANHVAVVVPCHRAHRSDGSIGGYAYGVTRKRALLMREGAK